MHLTWRARLSRSEGRLCVLSSGIERAFGVVSGGEARYRGTPDLRARCAAEDGSGKMLMVAGRGKILSAEPDTRMPSTEALVEP